MLRDVASRAIERLNRVVPKRAHAVVFSVPPLEGNAVETIRELTRRYRGPVYWFDGPADAAGLGERVLPVRKLSPRALFAYLSAEIVFVTHALYGAPTPVASQTLVNLWHGDGIKAKPAPRPGRKSILPATYVVGGTELLTNRKTVDFGMDPASAIVTGNPRIDQFRRGVHDGALERLGLDPRRPFVLWMPTYRFARTMGATSGWRDAPAAGPSVNETMQLVVERLRQRDVQVAVKPHLLDVEARSIQGAALADDAMLGLAQITCYELLGRSAGLVTDYSSVWTDYLLLDRPIGFLIPDKEQYASGRGVHPADVFEWLPGFVLGGPVELDLFIDDVLDSGRLSADRRREAARRLGLKRTRHAARDLLEELERRGAFPRSKTLRPDRR